MATFKEELKKAAVQAFNLQAKEITVNGNFQLPTLWSAQKSEQYFDIGLVYGPLTKQDESAILTDRAEKAAHIRDHLVDFLDLGTYIVNIRKISFEFQIKGGYSEREHTFITVRFNVELIEPEKYASTIGYYRLILDNVCKKGFRVDDLYKVADDLDVDVEGLTKEEMCSVLHERVNLLTLADFD